MNNIKIAIDGPAGVGKSTISKELSQKLNCVYVDTGAMYRTVALYFLNKNIDIVKNQKFIADNIDAVNIDIEIIDGSTHVFLNDEDVSQMIRTNEVSKGASDVGVILEVRKKLVFMQQKIANNKSVIMDGRDIGTKVLPNADYKFFLTATAEERANRRVKQLEEKGEHHDFDEILSQIKLRDENDKNRAVDPLRPADDAIIIDNTNLNFDETIQKILSLIKEI